MSTPNSFLQSLLNLFSGWFGRSRNSSLPNTRAVKMILNNTTEPVQVLSPRVLAVVFDPMWDRLTGRRLLQAPETAHWSRVDDLLAGYIADVEECSGGLVKYQVVERLVRDDFPIKEDRFAYDAATYLQALRTGRYHAPDWMDYGRVLNELRLLQRVEQGDCDEVWFFGAPGFGFYESRMAGRGAFWCNAPACENTDVCRKRFVLMGFSYERAVAKGEVAAPFEAQRQALDREEQAQLADLRHKLALRVQIKLLNVLHVIQPKLRLYVQLIPAQGSGGEIEIVFDPALQKIEAPVCPMCARPTLALALTRSSQVVCPACATQSLGQRPAKSS